MDGSKGVEHKRLQQLHQEDDSSQEHPFNKGSFASLSSSFAKFSQLQQSALTNSNPHSAASFRTLNSKLQLEGALPNIEPRSNSNLKHSGFYLGSGNDEDDDDEEEEDDISDSNEATAEHSIQPEFIPQPLYLASQKAGEDSAIAEDNNAQEGEDIMDLFRDTRKGYFEGLFVTQQCLNNNDKQDSLLSGNEKQENSSISDSFDNNEKINSFPFSDSHLIKTEWFNVTSLEDRYHSAKLQNMSFTNRQIYLLKKHWIKLFKFTLAYFIGMLLCVIPACRKWLVHNNSSSSSSFGEQKNIWFLPLAVLIHHPVHYSSVQIEMTLQALIGGLIAIAWSMLALFVSTCNLRLINNTFGVGALLWLSLFTSTLVSYWLSNNFRRLLYLSQTFTVAVIYFHLINVKEQFFQVSSDSVFLTNSMQKHWGDVIWTFSIPYAFGLAISLVISLCVFPEYDNKVLIQSYNRMISQMGLFIESIFDTSYDLKEAKEKLIQFNNFEFLKEYSERRRVFKFTSFSNDQIKTIRDDLIGLMTLIRAMPLDGTVGCHDCKCSISEIFGDSLKHIVNKMGALMKIDSQILNEKSKVNIEFLKQQETAISELELETKKIDSLYDSYKLPINKNDLSLMEVNSLLLINSIKTAANNITALSLDLNEIAKNSSKKTLQWPTLSLSSALKTLFAQCKLDQGFGDAYDTQHDSNETGKLLNEIYNTYTSKYSSRSSINDNAPGFKIRSSLIPTLDRNKFIDDQGFIRAIDGTDFRSKTATSEWRYRIWLLKEAIINDSLWYGFKAAFLFSFILIPGWLPMSYGWFSKYQTWAGCILFHILNNKNNIGGFQTILLRMFTCLIGCFFAWVANMMKPFSSPYIIMFISGLFCFICAHFFFNHHFTKNGIAGLLSFTIIVAQPWDNIHKSTANVWKHTWTTSLSLLIAALLSIVINWVLESKSTYTKINNSMSEVISHLGADFQLIVDRFLYKDCKDAATILDNEFSNALEIRLTKEIMKLENLIYKSFVEHKPFFHKSIDKIEYLGLVETCKNMLENLIQARQEVQFFDVYNADLNKDMTKFLMTFRTASVSSCCYNFFTLSNCFKEAFPLPNYLPNSIMARKQLYDKMELYEMSADKKTSQEKRANISNDELIHGMAFSQSFTNVTINLEKLVQQSKNVLGEDIKF
ncbi:hypothetical protein ACO0SA_001591 [Hanseniaspora valbyensis]